MPQRSSAANKKAAVPAASENWASQLASQPYWLRAILVVAVVAAYLTSLGGAFVFDDIPHIVRPDNLDNLSRAASSMMQLRTRSTTTMSFALNAALFGKSSLFFHSVNLLIHLVSVLTLFELVRGSIAWWNERHTPVLNASLIGFLAALLWGVHPLGTMAVTYIVQRHESLMAMFYLLTLYCLFRGQLAGTAWPWYVGSILCCWLGMGAKEVMVTAPLVALVYDRCILSTSWREVVTKRGWVFAMFLVPAVIVVIKNLSIFKPGTSGHSAVLGANETASAWLYLWTQAGVLVHYLRLSLFPDYLAFDYDWPVADTEREYLLPALFILGLLILSFWLLFKRPAIGFVAITFFFILAPTSSIVPIVDVAFEHRMYLPLACVCVLVAIGLGMATERWRSRQSDESKYQTFLLIGLTLAVLLGMRTVYRNLDYHSQLALWKTTVQARPMNLRANHNLSQQLREENRLPEVEQILQRSISYCEQHGYESFPLHGDLAETYVYTGQFDKAYERFQIALEDAQSMPELTSDYRTLLRNRKLAETHTSFGALLDLLQRPAEAAKQFDQAIELRPDVTQSYVMAGDAYRKSGDFETALVRWEEAVRRDPKRVSVARDYAMLLMQLGRYDEAAKRLQQITKTQPDDLLTQFQLARLEAATPSDKVRDPNSAIKRCDQLLQAHPQHALEIQQIKAMALGNGGQTDQAIALLTSLSKQISDAEVRKDLHAMTARFQQKQKVLLGGDDTKR